MAQKLRYGPRFGSSFSAPERDLYERNPLKMTHTPEAAAASEKRRALASAMHNAGPGSKHRADQNLRKFD